MSNKGTIGIDFEYYVVISYMDHTLLGVSVNLYNIIVDSLNVFGGVMELPAELTLL